MIAIRGTPLLTLAALSTLPAAAQEVVPQRPRDAARYAGTFVAGLGTPGKCPAEVDADPGRAVGVVVRPDPYPFFLFVPEKGVEKVDLTGKEAGTGHGVAVGYLFGGPMGTPVVDGQLVDWQRMRHAEVQDPGVGKLFFNCIALTAARRKDGVLVLHGFGVGEEPLFSVPLEKAEKAGTSVAVKDLDVGALRLKLDLCFGDGRRALIPFGARRRE